MEEEVWDVTVTAKLRKSEIRDESPVSCVVKIPNSDYVKEETITYDGMKSFLLNIFSPFWQIAMINVQMSFNNKFMKSCVANFRLLRLFKRAGILLSNMLHDSNSFVRPRTREKYFRGNFRSKYFYYSVWNDLITDMCLKTIGIETNIVHKLPVNLEVVNQYKTNRCSCRMDGQNFSN